MLRFSFGLVGALGSQLREPRFQYQHPGVNVTSRTVLVGKHHLESLQSCVSVYVNGKWPQMQTNLFELTKIMDLKKAGNLCAHPICVHANFRKFSLSFLYDKGRRA